MADKAGQLHESWQRVLGDELQLPYMQSLKSFLQAEKRAGKTVYPPGNQIFAAFNLTPFEQVKVVIIGQDPYHGPGQAHGLCFSVQPGVEPPPSLVNIFKEIQQEFDCAPPPNGSLVSWAAQGVLLLNAVLTVERSRPASHQNRGWERFTDQAIAALNREHEHLVFLLWGSYAQRKGQHIDKGRHLVLSSPHPSPLSAHRGFFGNHHFGRTNEYLQAHGRTAIDWCLSDQAK